MGEDLGGLLMAVRSVQLLLVLADFRSLYDVSLEDIGEFVLAVGHALFFVSLAGLKFSRHLVYQAFHQRGFADRLEFAQGPEGEAFADRLTASFVLVSR